MDAAEQVLGRCLSRVAAEGHIRWYGATQVQRLGADSCSFRVRVPFPDRYKNAGVFMVESATVRVFDRFGRQENGVWRVGNVQGEQLCVNDLQAAPDAFYAGFLNAPVDFDLNRPCTMVRTVNALRNSTCRGALTKAVQGMRTALATMGDNFRDTVVCRHCGESGQLSRHDDVLQVPAHGPRSRCSDFEPVGRTPQDHLMVLCGKALAHAPVRNILDKYKRGGALPTPADERHEVLPMEFAHFVLALWEDLLLNASRVSPSGIDELVVDSLRLAPGEDEKVNVCVDIHIAQFFWDNPNTCADHLSRLYTLDPQPPDVILSLDELLRVTTIAFNEQTAVK